MNLVSLSQAKRLLARFERFKEVIPDFKGLDTIGQTFADEVFRAYPSQYLQVHIVPLNFNDHIENMILGVADRTGSAALRLPGKWRDGKLVSTTKVSRPTR